MNANELARVAPAMIALSIVLGGASCHATGRKVDLVAGPEHVPLRGTITQLDYYQSRTAVAATYWPEVDSRGEVPVRVAFQADLRTEWDTNGNPDEALNMLFIRHDRPGMMALALLDPSLYLLPEKPMEGRPSDRELDESTVSVVESQTYDLLAYGRHHGGSGEYFVLAAFSDSWHGPGRMRLTDPSSGPREAGTLEPTPASDGSEPAPASRSVVARPVWLNGKVAVVGGFRVAAAADASQAPFLSIVLARLRSKGGVITGQVGVPARREQDDVLGSFKVVVQDLRSARGELTPGKYALFAFVGAEAAPVRVFKVE